MRSSPPTLVLLAVGLALCTSTAHAQPGPKKKDLYRTYHVKGTDSVGGVYTGTLLVRPRGNALADMVSQVWTEAELHYASGGVKRWESIGWYSRSKGEISVSYKYFTSGFIGRLAGTGHKVRVRGKLRVNAATNGLKGTFSGNGFTAQEVATRVGPATRTLSHGLNGSYVVRANWTHMSEWRLEFKDSVFQDAKIDSRESKTRCEWLSKDTLCLSVWSNHWGSGLVTKEEIILKVKQNRTGATADLAPVRCFTVTIDPSANDPNSHDLKVQRDSETSVEQPDGRVLN